MQLSPLDPTTAGRKPKRRRSRLFKAGVVVIALIVSTLGFFEFADWTSTKFFDSGKDILATLTGLAHGIQDGNAAGIESAYSPQFHGSSLGLLNLNETEAKDG